MGDDGMDAGYGLLAMYGLFIMGCGSESTTPVAQNHQAANPFPATRPGRNIFPQGVPTLGQSWCSWDTIVRIPQKAQLLLCRGAEIPGKN